MEKQELWRLRKEQTGKKDVLESGMKKLLRIGEESDQGGEIV